MVLESTLDTVGLVVSMIMASLAASELAAPGVARVRVAVLPAASLMVPLLRTREPTAL